MRRMKRCNFSSIGHMLLVGGMAFALFSAGVDAQDPAGENALRTLSIAESQHEIVQLLIAKGEYSKAVKELLVILNLGLPPQYEEAVFKEVAIVASKMYDLNQKDHSYQVLDMGLKSVQTPEFKAKILNIKAGFLKRDGRIGEAIYTYRQEIEIREKNLPR